MASARQATPPSHTSHRCIPATMPETLVHGILLATDAPEGASSGIAVPHPHSLRRGTRFKIDSGSCTRRLLVPSLRLRAG